MKIKNKSAVAQIKARLTRHISPFNHTFKAVQKMSDADRAILATAINSENPAVTLQGNFTCPFCGGTIRTKFQQSFQFGTGNWIYHCKDCGNLQDSLTGFIAKVNNLDIAADFCTVLTIGGSLINKNLDNLDNGAAVIDFVSNLKNVEKSVQMIKENAKLRTLSPAEVAERLGVDLGTAKKACEKVAQKTNTPVKTLESPNNDTTNPTQHSLKKTLNPPPPVNDAYNANTAVKNTASPLPPLNAEPRVDLEKFVLSSMLMKNGAVVPAVSAILNADDFYRPEHKIIFSCLVNQYQKLARTDFLALVEELKTSGALWKVGTELIFSLPQWANTTAYSDYYAKIIKTVADNRRIQKITEQMIADTRAGLKTPAEIIADATAEFEKIQSAAADETTHLTNGKNYFEKFFGAEVEENKKFADRSTGFSNIDEHQIFSAGLYVLGAISANGKTTFAWQLLNQLAQRGETCIYCSYEMSRLELFSKSVAAELYNHDPFTTITSADIRRGAWTPSLNGIIENLKQSTANINVFELSGETVDELLNLLKPLCKRAEKPPVVVVDYLQIIPSSKDNLKQGIDDTVRKLKVFQRETGTTFIVISSFNRSNYVASVSFESFKESGNIEYSADVIWGLQLNIMNSGAIKDGTGIIKAREAINEALKENPRAMHLRCLKNRQGQNYDCYFNYYSAHDYFEPCDESDFKEVDGPPEPINNSNADESDIGV